MKQYEYVCRFDVKMTDVHDVYFLNNEGLFTMNIDEAKTFTNMDEAQEFIQSTIYKSCAYVCDKYLQ